MNARYVLLILGLITFRTQAQRTDEVNQLINLGRDSVITLAIYSLGNGFAGDEFGGWGSHHFRSVDPEIFDRLTVLTDGSDVKVAFERSIMYYPLKTDVVMGAEVKLVSQSIGFSDALTNDAGEEISQFYKYTAEDHKAITFIKTHHGPLLEGQTMTINEQNDYYMVSVLDEKSEGGYKLDKKTGQEYDNWHANKTAEFDDGYRAIDWEY